MRALLTTTLCLSLALLVGAATGCQGDDNDTGLGDAHSRGAQRGGGGGGGWGGGGAGGGAGTDGGTDGGTSEQTEPEPEPEPYGPENRWYHATTDQIPPGLAGTGYREGDTAHNLTVVDQHGDTVELYQFYGQVIVLDLFAEW